MRESTELQQLKCRVTRKLGGVHQAHATPHRTLFQPCPYYPLPSCLPSMHKKGTQSLKGGRGRLLTKRICCFEHYNGLIHYFITDSYLILVSFSIGFLYTLKQKLIFWFWPITQKLRRKYVEPNTKWPKVLELCPPPQNSAFETSYLPTNIKKYHTLISLVGGRWHQKHNHKRIFPNFKFSSRHKRLKNDRIKPPFLQKFPLLPYWLKQFFFWLHVIGDNFRTDL